jgi:hypothetical protein
MRTLRRRHHELVLVEAGLANLREPSGQVFAQRSVHGSS